MLQHLCFASSYLYALQRILVSLYVFLTYMTLYNVHFIRERTYTSKSAIKCRNRWEKANPFGTRIQHRFSVFFFFSLFFAVAVRACVVVVVALIPFLWLEMIAASYIFDGLNFSKKRTVSILKWLHRKGKFARFGLHDDVVEFVMPYNIFCFKCKQRHANAKEEKNK